MLRYRFVLIFIFLPSFHVIGQISADSIKIQKLIRMSEDSVRANGPFSLEKIDSALLLFETRHFSKDSILYAFLQLQWGYAHGLHVQEQVPEAIAACRGAIDLLERRLNPKDRMTLARALQKLGTLYANRQQLAEAKECLQQSLDIRRQSLPPGHINFAISLQALANVFSDQGNYAEAYSLYEEAYRIRLKHLSKNDPRTYISLYDLGRTRTLMEDYTGALDYMLEAYQSFTEQGWREDLAYSHICNSLGNCYYGLGEYDQAILFYEKALAARHDIMMEGRIQPNIGLCYVEKGEYELANRYFEQSIKAFANMPRDFPARMDARLHRAFNEIKARHFDQALLQLESLKDSLIACKMGPAFWHRLNTLKGDAWFEKGVRDSALIYWRQAIPAKGKPTDLSSFDMAENYYKMSRCSEGLTALSLADSAIYWSGYLPGTDQKHNFSSVPNYFAARLRALQQIQGGQSNADSIEKACAETMQALSACRERSDWEATRQIFLDRNQSVSGQVVQAILLQYEKSREFRLLDLAFQYAGQAKSIALEAAANRANILHIEGVPDSLVRSRRQADIELAWIEKKLWEERSNALNEKDAAVRELLQQHSAKLSALLQVESRLMEYPEWQKINVKRQSMSIRDAQRLLLLHENQVLVQFVESPDYLFQFIVRKDSALVHRIPLDAALRQSMDSLALYISASFYNAGGEREKSSNAAYIRSARLLYDKLVAPVYNEWRQDVLAVLDGHLSKVPLDALLVSDPPEKANSRDYSFLMHAFDIHYSWSPDLQLRLLNSAYSNKKYEHSLAGFAPFGRKDEYMLQGLDTLVQRETGRKVQYKLLKHSYSEVVVAARIMDGISYVDSLASLEQFKNVAGYSRIIQLATHADQDSLNGDYGHLVFYPKKDHSPFLLYAREIYAMQIPAEMVVLSACNSGDGAYRGGEGVVSLARAFVWAGAGSVVSSNWSANDASTEYLMIHFYKYLKSGKSKSEALRRAKLDMLKNPGLDEAQRFRKNGVDYSRFGHAYLWAGFTLLGNDKKF